MAHITEIKIDGLLGRKEQLHLKLDKHVNIFFGENGCGKTTLLKILDAGLSLNGELMEQLPVRRAELHIYSLKREQHVKQVWERREPVKRSKSAQPMLFPIDGEVQLMGVDYPDTADSAVLARRSATGSAWKLTPDVGDELGGWKHTFLPTSRLYSGDVRLRRPNESGGLLSERQLDDAFAEAVNRAWLRYYNQTLGVVRSIQEEGLRTVLRHVLIPPRSKKPRNASGAEEAYKRVKKFLSRQSPIEALDLGSKEKFATRYASDANLQEVVDNIDNIERRIETAMLPVDRFRETVGSLFRSGKSLEVSPTELQFLMDDGKRLSVAHLSAGEKHLLKILLAAMNAGNGLVLIDEPELSMHIDWQLAFVNVVSSMNHGCQLLLASHSPEIMAKVDDSCIFRL